MASVCKAVAAIDGAVAAGLEGNLTGLAAFGTHSVVHHALRTGRLTLTGGTASLAALGLILEAALSVKLLLTCGENKFLAAVLAN